MPWIPMDPTGPETPMQMRIRAAMARYHQRVTLTKQKTHWYDDPMKQEDYDQREKWIGAWFHYLGAEYKRHG